MRFVEISDLPSGTKKMPVDKSLWHQEIPYSSSESLSVITHEPEEIITS